MKVILVNGSPKEHGCTYTALCETQKVLNENGIETQIFYIGKENINGCLACGGCAKTKKCVQSAKVGEFLQLAASADGFVFASPVHYAAASGILTSFMDRAFFSGSDKLAFKPAAAVVSARRAGTTAALEQITKYFTISNMPVVSSNYWPMVHGVCPQDVKKDEEGLQICRNLANNMAWLLKCIKLGKENGICHAEPEPKIKTNFIR